MRGQPEFGFPAFDAAAERLRSVGYVVWSPAERDRRHGFDPQGLTGCEDLAALGLDLPVVLADCLIHICLHTGGVALLPGWEHSAGARAEWHTAAALDLPCRPVDEWVDLAGDDDEGGTP
jgi:hypothetical protein